VRAREEEDPIEIVIQLLANFLRIYIICMIAWVVISWLPQISPGLAFNSTVLAIRRFLDSVILPYVRLFRFIPPVRLGNAMIDVSVIVAILVLQIGGGLLLGVLAASFT